MRMMFLVTMALLTSPQAEASLSCQSFYVSFLNHEGTNFSCFQDCTGNTVKLGFSMRTKKAQLSIDTSEKSRLLSPEKPDYETAFAQFQAKCARGLTILELEWLQGPVSTAMKRGQSKRAKCLAWHFILNDLQKPVAQDSATAPVKNICQISAAH